MFGVPARNLKMRLLHRVQSRDRESEWRLEFGYIERVRGCRAGPPWTRDGRNDTYIYKTRENTKRFFVFRF